MNLLAFLLAQTGDASQGNYWDRLGHQALSTVVFTSIGLIAFGIVFLVVIKFTPFSVRKEIEEDQNTSLAIIIGSIIIAIGMIIAATVHG
jgi:uncharacterized membrane protein YjfL (UPF0719 family)